MKIKIAITRFSVGSPVPAPGESAENRNIFFLQLHPNSHFLPQPSCRLDPDQACLGKVCSRLSPAAGFSEAPGPITEPLLLPSQERSATRAWGLFYAADPVFEMWKIIVSMHANEKCLLDLYN